MQNILLSLATSLLSSATVQKLIAAEVQKLFGGVAVHFTPLMQQVISSLMHTTAPMDTIKTVKAAPSQAVKNIQHALNVAGFGPLAEDGHLGTKTEAALKAAGAKFGLPI